MNQRITFFLQNLKIGGIQRMFVKLANNFASQGYSVDLVLATEGGGMENDVVNTVRIVNLSASRVLTSLPSFLRYTRSCRPDVIVSGHDSINHLLSLCGATGLFDARLVVSIHTQMSRLAKLEGVWYSKAIPFLTQWTYPLADQIVAVSEGAAIDLQTMCIKLDGKVNVIYNPVVDDTLRIKSRAIVDHPWFKDTSVPVILGIGRMTPGKNFPLLLDAFQRIQKSTQTKLMILGGGPEIIRLREMIRDRDLTAHVELPGYVSNPYAYLSKASLFVLSSDFEGLPTVLIEALACGCPVVSTNCPSGPSEILERGKWGYLVPVGDAEALAEAMVKTLDNPPERHSLKGRAEAFNVENATKKYEEIFFPTTTSRPEWKD